VATGDSSEAIDLSFQRSAIWRHVKTEFPEWYGERLKEAAKLAADKRGETVIAKHLTEAMVTLRRKHADQALTASPERLRFVATAFLDNLQAMAKQNVDTCYGFISQGETYPPVLDMLQKPDANQGLQKQLMAVFEAISEGRKAPQSYLPPRKSDYDTLAAELNARGWSENDLRTFSDPRALGRFMRKMAAQTGEGMGEEFDEVVGRLEKGEDPDKIEQSMGDLFGAGGPPDGMGGPDDDYTAPSPAPMADEPAAKPRSTAKPARRPVTAKAAPKRPAKPKAKAKQTRA
jgi:hypothetical protein